jgi:iron complex transport system ATP-binding protein
MKNDQLLRTENLTLGYRRDTIADPLFQNLTLGLYAGELICLMGPNGIGKSTLIRTLAGLQPSLGGNIIYKSASGTDPRQREKNISVILSERVTAVNMTVYELVSFGRYPYLDWSVQLRTHDREIIDQAINQVHLRHLATRKIDELSDGQMQMVMIARALAQDTPVMLLDEPTAHLDLNNRFEIMNLLRQLSRVTGKAILISTHELNLALQTADLIWLATKEKTIKAGTPEDLILDGSFESVFQFSGYDLKTGKVEQAAFRKISIRLEGEGASYSWTRNALERNGYEVTRESTIVVKIEGDKKFTWRTSDESFSSIGDLLAALETYDLV